MEIEITNESNGYYIYHKNSNVPILNMRENFLNKFTFQDQDIENLLGIKKYDDDFLKGGYKFNVPKKHLDLICGNRSAQNKTELLMYND